MALPSATLRSCLLAAAHLLTGGCAEGSGPPLIAVAGGTAYLDAARLAVQEAEEAGTLPPFDTLFLVEVSNRAAPALAIAGEVVSHPDLVAVVGHANSASSLATAQIYNQSEVVQIAPTSTAPAYSEAGPWSFRMVPSDARQGLFLVERVAEAFPDGARIALFYVNDDYGRGIRNAVRATLPGGRFPLVVDLPHLEGDVKDQDVRRGIAALEAASPDVILWLARPEVLARFLPSIREQWPALPIIAGDAVARALTLSHEPSFWRGVAYSDFVDPADPDVAAFLTRFEARVGTRGSGGEVLVRDAVRMVLEAIRDGSRTSAEIRAWLESLGSRRAAFEGLSGQVAFDPAGDVRGSRFVLRRFDEGG
ncbi:MAG: branched-chain amino acid ABC transporter substrate-binding protein [Longimicrobiales bacterium]|nr:branched-chain amino acid ABC transporter substrate-binding protein [Longimicrobiales bacterium]